MRVLHLATTYPLHAADSNATFVESIVEGLCARGHECDVLVPWHPELVSAGRGRARLLPFRYSPLRAWHPWGYAQALTADRELRRDAYVAAPLAAASAWRAIRRLHRQRPYDLLHAHWFLPNGAIAAHAWRRSDRPLVVSCHGSGVYLAEKHGWARKLGAYTRARATAVTACSADLAGRVDRIGDGPAAQRVPYGVDTGRFRPLAADAVAAGRERLAGRHGLRSDVPWVFAIGRLVYKKGFEVLIDAVAEAAAEGTVLELVIAGGGPLETPLRERAADRGLAGRVHLVGAVPNEEVPLHYAVADIVAVPSVHDRDGNVDGLPNTLLEALSSGAAVVASRVAGIPDVVRDGDNGLLFPERDAAGLSARLRELAAEREARAALGRRARADAEAQLDWARTVERFEQVYLAAGASA